MSPDERRKMIVQAVLPLVAEHGAAVRTSQMAAACGIGEATIFRVFADKEELLDACVAEALRLDQVLDAIRAIPLDVPLPDRLHEAVTALDAHLTRMGRVMAAMYATRGGDGRGRPAPGDGGGGEGGGEGEEGRPRGERGRPAPGAREEAMAQTRDALAELFAPEQDRLRLPADRLASALMGMLFARSRNLHGEQDPAPLAEIVDLFLHGALTSPGEA